jgi:hypothetical protein
LDGFFSGVHVLPDGHLYDPEEGHNPSRKKEHYAIQIKFISPAGISIGHLQFGAHYLRFSLLRPNQASQIDASLRFPLASACFIALFPQILPNPGHIFRRGVASLHPASHLCQSSCFLLASVCFITIFPQILLSRRMISPPSGPFRLSFSLASHTIDLSTILAAIGGQILDRHSRKMNY